MKINKIKYTTPACDLELYIAAMERTGHADRCWSEKAPLCSPLRKITKKQYLHNIVWISAYKTTRVHKINTEILWRW